LAAGVLAVGSAVAIGLTLSRREATPAPAAASALASASASGGVESRPLAVTDAPPPPTESAAAAAEYRAGLQAYRDASLVLAREHMSRATELDGGLAAAHLRVAVWNKFESDADARSHFAHALALRASLSERDRTILDAITPFFLDSPQQSRLAAARLREAAAKNPRDAEMALLVSQFEELDGDAASVDAVERALRIDPSFATAMWERAVIERDSGRVGAALEWLGRCLATSPAAASCGRFRSLVEQNRGECAAMEEDARRTIKIETDGPRAR
jgi:hypothetical protein